MEHTVCGKFFASINFLKSPSTPQQKNLSFNFATKSPPPPPPSPSTISRIKCNSASEPNLSLHYNTEMIARDYHTYLSVWVAVGDKLPCQANKLLLSKDLLAIAVKWKASWSLVLFQKYFLQFGWCFFDKLRSILCLWIYGWTAMCLIFSTCQENI